MKLLEGVPKSISKSTFYFYSFHLFYVKLKKSPLILLINPLFGKENRPPFPALFQLISSFGSINFLFSFYFCYLWRFEFLPSHLYEKLLLRRLFSLCITSSFGCPNLLFSPTPINAMLGLTASKNS